MVAAHGAGFRDARFRLSHARPAHEALALARRKRIGGGLRYRRAGLREYALAGARSTCASGGGVKVLPEMHKCEEIGPFPWVCQLSFHWQCGSNAVARPG